MWRHLAVVAPTLLWCSSCCLARPSASPDPIEPELRCETDEDCTICNFDHGFSSAEGCECYGCSGFYMRRDACTLFHESWMEHCSHMEEGETCPNVDCDAPPEPVCAEGRCDLDRGE